MGLTAPISLYEGTKHTFATNAKRRGVEDRLLQRFLGHRDRRSVERYARLADEALIAVLRPLRPTPDGDGLSPACRQGQERSRKPSNPLKNLVEAAGIEPASAHPSSVRNQALSVRRGRAVEVQSTRAAPPTRKLRSFIL